MNKTKIAWTEQTWNPVHGCSKWSDGCRNCYAEVMAKRLQGMGVKTYENGFAVTLNPDELDKPKGRKKPTMYFVCSMGDLFHSKVPIEYIDRVMEVIEGCPQHTFQILTKRDLRMHDYFVGHRRGNVPKNVWLGVSIEGPLQVLRTVPLTGIRNATVRFLSCEPLIGKLHYGHDIDLNGIDWVICGGESGNQARPMSKEWVMHLKDLCDERGVPFFFKQWGTYGEDGVKRNVKANGHLLDGMEYRAWPKGKPVRTFDNTCPIGKKGDLKCTTCQFDGGLTDISATSCVQMCAFPREVREKGGDQ